MNYKFITSNSICHGIMQLQINQINKIFNEDMYKV